MRNSRLFFPIGLVLIAFLVVAPIQREHRRAAAASTSPNIVLILTDDQRWDTLWAMPHVQSELIAHGVQFTNAMVVNSLCCPSRATILTGEYSHSTGVYENSGLYGGFRAFDDSSTIATWLQGGGYHTGLVGKYLNQYSINYIPPGWDRWVAFLGIPNGGAYYDYTLTEDGTEVRYGHTNADYSTDVLTAQADSFIREAPPSQPLFLYFSPFAPHTPYTPATEYQGAFDHLPPYRPPNFNEADVSDKPQWVQALPLLSLSQQRTIDKQRKDQYRTLLSVDDAVDTIVAALSDTGRLGNTLIAFASDNGLSNGEHRWGNKKVAWEESIRVPMIVRYDPLTSSPRKDSHLVANIDLAPTFASAAEVPALGAEGMDMMTLLRDPGAAWRHDLLAEHLNYNPESDYDGSPSTPVPTYCAIRSDALQREGYTYVVYVTGEEELYDLKTDEWELTNVASDPFYAGVLATLRATAQTLCEPAPPGFGWPYDALPPSTPTGLTGVPAPGEVTLTWEPSTDNFAVTGYTIYRDQIGLVTGDGSTTSYVDSTVLPDTIYTYTVDAFDGAGNRSLQCDPVIVKTPGSRSTRL